jgi:hypothetical protein
MRERDVSLRILFDSLLIGVEVFAGHPFTAHGKGA